MATRKCNWCKKEKAETQTRTISLTTDGSSKKVYCRECVFNKEYGSLHGYQKFFKKKAKEMEIELSKREQERQGRKYGVIEVPPKKN